MFEMDTVNGRFLGAISVCASCLISPVYSILKLMISFFKLNLSIASISHNVNVNVFPSCFMLNNTDDFNNSVRTVTLRTLQRTYVSLTVSTAAFSFMSKLMVILPLVGTSELSKIISGTMLASVLVFMASLLHCRLFRKGFSVAWSLIEYFSR